MAKMLGSKMMSSGGKPTCSVRIRYARRADLDLALGGVGLAPLVERHHDHRRAVAADQPGLLDERGLALLERDRVDDALALDALEPRLDAPTTWSESIMIGTRRCRAPTAISLRNVVIACSESSIPSSMFTSIIWAPLSTCWRATSSAASYSPVENQLARSVASR